MKGYLTALLALTVLSTTVDEAEAQFRQNSAVQFGMKVGASSYSGDIGPAAPGTPAFDATYEFEGFYRFNRWINIGVKHSTGSYPALRGTSDRRHSTALGLRSYFLKGRFSPYLQVGVSRSYGGEKAGMGLSTAVGAEIAISHRFALFQDVSFDTVFPDEALDGSIGGRAYDMFGRIGIGIRVSLGKNPGILRIARVEFPDAIEAGKPVRLEAVLLDSRDGASVEWDLPGGVVYQTNPVEHTFSTPGRYEFDVVATGGEGKRATKRVSIDVNPSAESIAAAAVDSTVGMVVIETLYGPRVTVAGTESIYRVRLGDGAEQPVEYLWDMGDGGLIEGNNVAYRFTEPGTHAIRAWVRNAVGTDSITIAVLVDPAEGPSKQPPVVAEVVASNEELPVGATQEGTQENSAAAAESSGAAELIAKKIAAAAPPPQAESKVDPLESRETESQPEVQPESQLQPQESREVVLQAPPIPGIDWSLGGYTWVVESAKTRDAATKLVPSYESLGFPVGVYRDAYQGKVEYHVVVGQSASEKVAERIGSRIQRHVPRRIWLLEIPR